MLTKKIFRTLSSLTFREPIKTITVIGGGKIGCGITQIAAQNAQKVNLVELNQECLKKSAEKIIDSLTNFARGLYRDNEMQIKKYVENTMDYITGTTNLQSAVKNCDLLIEALPEDFDKKIEVFKNADLATPSRTIFATTTDSLSVNAFARKSTRIERFVGLHFFYPVPSSKLVEVVKVPLTANATVELVTDWCREVGKSFIVCNDSPGFVVNRLLITYITEAIRMTERADASAEDIDTAMRLVTGQGLGPIQLADYFGHDTISKMVDTWRIREPENIIFQPCPSQRKLVEDGKLGVKNGEGFYKYNDLKYWITHFSHRFKNKKDWTKYYQIWKRTIEKAKQRNA